jgi:prolyl-tRNA editing enzyme YbaK/EbsC (Cys-tRNA(Pro) deacylase)
MTLHKLIDETKIVSFVEDYEVDDTEALGVLIAKHFKHDGQQIFQTMFFAMEDANFHTFNEEAVKLWKNLTRKNNG